jgi:hypothetical protein
VKTVKFSEIRRREEKLGSSIVCGATSPGLLHLGCTTYNSCKKYIFKKTHQNALRVSI